MQPSQTSRGSIQPVASSANARAVDEIGVEVDDQMAFLEQLRMPCRTSKSTRFQLVDDRVDVCRWHEEIDIVHRPAAGVRIERDERRTWHDRHLPDMLIHHLLEQAAELDEGCDLAIALMQKRPFRFWNRNTGGCATLIQKTFDLFCPRPGGPRPTTLPRQRGEDAQYRLLSTRVAATTHSPAASSRSTRSNSLRIDATSCSIPTASDS